jgi:hypothetical protein
MDLNIELNQSHPDMDSIVFLFYGTEVNVSANLLHRVEKIIECALAHTYSHRYDSQANPPPLVFNANSISAYLSDLFAQHETSLTDELNAQLKLERIARKLEKYIPLTNLSVTLKEPHVRFHPFSHFMIAPIASQVFLNLTNHYLERNTETDYFCSKDANYECFFDLNAKYLHFSTTRPVDEKLLFDVVSKLTNPSKKLIYDSYVHSQITVNRLRLIKKKKKKDVQHL